MVRARLHTPSWRQGFARYQCRSAYPGLWDGLVGAWLPALGPTGLTLYDIGGRGNHGTLINMAPAADWVTTGRQGLPHALDFDGVGAFANLGTNVIRGLERFSFCFWYNPAVNPQPAAFAGILHTHYNDFRITACVDDPRALYFRSSDDLGIPNFSTTADVFPLNEWSLVSGTWDGLNYVWYVNGNRDTATTGTPGGTVTSTLPLLMGLYGTSHFQGKLSNLSIHNRVLAPNEIQTLYRDPPALVRCRAMLFPAVTGVPDRYDVVAGLPYVAGSTAGDAYTNGSVAGAVA